MNTSLSTSIPTSMTGSLLRFRSISGLKSLGTNGRVFFGSRFALAIMASTDEVAAQVCWARASAIVASSRSVSLPGSVPTTPANC